MEPIYVQPASSLDSILALFRNGNVHVAVVTDKPGAMVQEAKIAARALKKNEDKAEETSEAKSPATFVFHGIVTMENVLEGMLNMNIKDEKDLSRSYDASLLAAEGAAENETSAEIKPPMYSSQGPNNSLLVNEEEQVYKPTYFRAFVDAVKGRLTTSQGGLGGKLAKSTTTNKINADGEDDEIEEEDGRKTLDGVDQEGGELKNQDIKKKFDGQPAFGQQLRRNKKQKKSQLSQSLL